MLHMFIQAIDDIEENQEIFSSYGDDYWDLRRSPE